MQILNEQSEGTHCCRGTGSKHAQFPRALHPCTCFECGINDCDHAVSVFRYIASLVLQHHLSRGNPTQTYDIVLPRPSFPTIIIIALFATRCQGFIIYFLGWLPLLCLPALSF